MPLSTEKESDTWSLKDSSVDWSLSMASKKCMILAGYPSSVIFLKILEVMAFGNALVISRKMMVVTFFHHQAFLMQWVRYSRESEVVLPGRPQKCCGGSSPCHTVR